MFLKRQELKELTGLTRADAQIRALNHMRIQYSVRPDGIPMVLRAHVEVVMGLPLRSMEKRKTKPDFSKVM